MYTYKIKVSKEINNWTFYDILAVKLEHLSYNIHIILHKLNNNHPTFILHEDESMGWIKTQNNKPVYFKFDNVSHFKDAIINVEINKD